MNATLTAFTASATLATSYFDRDDSTTSNNLHRYRFIATTLSQGTAEGWAELGSPLIGAGSAVHLSWHHNTNFAVSTTSQTISVRNATMNGACLSPMTPGTEPFSNIDGTYVNFFDWNATVATPLVCGVGGTVSFVRETTNPERIKMTFNVQFSDGTTWIDKVLYGTYRKGT